MSAFVAYMTKRIEASQLANKERTFSMPQTLFEKIWHEHVIVTRDDGNSLLYVDRHLIHDLHFRAFAQLKAAGHSIREPEKLFGVPDHSLPTTAKLLADIPAGEMREAVEVLEQASKEFNFTHFSMTDDRHGIVHVIGPEQGITYRSPLPSARMVPASIHALLWGNRHEEPAGSDVLQSAPFVPAGSQLRLHHARLYPGGVTPQANQLCKTHSSPQTGGRQADSNQHH